MTTPFLGEIQILGFNYAPNGWAQCNGALLPIRQNTALFSLIGTYYGGDGRITFQLPNFTGRAACSQGQGPGLTPRSVGETFGEEQLVLTSGQMPGHSHAVNAYLQPDMTLRNDTPANGNGLNLPAGSLPFVPNASPNVNFAGNVIGSAGGGAPHENRQPLLPLNFCIALQGVFPSFS